ncbi:MAG: hydantoinase/oxoprolinase family protein [Candidatus Thorarchaeota archaeon]
MKIIGVDVGGTFTDIIMLATESGQQYVHKVPSTPESQDIAVVRGIRELLDREGVSPSEVKLLVHGTTVATNAMLERKGATVCLITTKGFEDVLEIGRQNRTDIYDIHATRPMPLVERSDRIGVLERVDWQGEPIIPLSQSEIDRIVLEISTRKPDSIAISLLFSFKHSEHENRLLHALKESFDGYSVASSDVLPEFREFERMSTTVLEAYLGPLVIGYLGKLKRSVAELCPNARLNVMQSNGGTMHASRAQGRAVGLAISGLAGGVVGGWEVAKQADILNALTLDMGGTSCDISAVSGGVVVRPDNEVDGLPLRFPSVDVKTIGAGGGSIAWLDTAGILHVGPQSAGAVPGPASYDKGGTLPTVTDANLILGRLNPEFFVGGEIQLNSKRAYNAIKKVAQQIGLSVEEAAAGITRISTSNMVQAIREVTIERGKDPRDFVLIAFGGAGPTQAVDIAASLRIHSILVPHHPGITSAFGLVCADLRVDLMRSILLDASPENSEQLREVFSSLENMAVERLIEQGASEGEITIHRMLDMRYTGQSHELSIKIPDEVEMNQFHTQELFETEHETQFGYRLKGERTEWVTARVTASYPQPRTRSRVVVNEALGEAEIFRTVILNDGIKRDARVIHRENLPTMKKIQGPLIVEQLDTTTWVSPEWSLEMRRDGLLWVRRERV